MRSYKKIFLMVSILLQCGWSIAQTDKFALSGQVKDASSGEALTGAMVSVKDMPAVGAIADIDGAFNLKLQAGRYTIQVQYFGYKSIDTTVSVSQDLRLNIRMHPDVTELKEIVLKKEAKNDNITKPQIGVEKIEMAEINKIPVLMGERDVLKSITMIPGVKSAGEGNTGFYVRGGGADQNLILLDEAPVYNASHLLGFFSVFNSDAIKEATLYKGGIPAEYGGRLSSVLDIKMKEGNVNKFGGSGGIGLISSRLALEGPIVREKGSFNIYGRRSYADMFLKLSSNEALRSSKLHFYDLNAKANYQIGKKTRLYFSGYMGRDVLGYRDIFGMDWGNATATVRLNHVFNEKLVSNTYLIYSDYSYRIKIDVNQNEIFINSMIRDYNLRQDFDYSFSPRSRLKFGVNSIFHKVVPGELSLNSPLRSLNESITHRHSWENAAYISHDFKFTDKFSVVYGLRLSAFSVLGGGDFYDIDDQGELQGSTYYERGEFVKTYFNPEPRIAASYVINSSHSIKASYGRTTQNMHLLSNTTTGSPTDLWISSSNYIRPEIADQVSLGYFRNFKEDRFQFSTEVYYKDLQNQIDYKNRAELNFNETVETQLLLGTGRAYGVEFFLKKKYGKLNGWIGYTLSRSERRFDQINNGNYFPARQDRTHDISIVGIYDLNPKWTLSATWVYNTGNAVTFPNGKYQVNGQVFNYYTERNGSRMPAYHRMDIGATKTIKKTERFESSWTFSVYNLYGRENAFMIMFRPSETDASRTEALQISLFRMIPSFSYNFKF